MYYRQMGEIIQNNGILLEHDNLMTAPDGSSRAGGGFFFVYLGAYSYLFFHILFPSMLLWQFLIWFPALLASLAAIPMYFIGKILYDRKAGILAAFFYVFDISVISRSLGGDPDSDCIILLIPLIVMAFFLFAYKYIEKNNKFDKKVILYSVLTAVSLAVWYQVWSGYWYITMMITGFVILMLIARFIKIRKLKEFLSQSKPLIMSFLTIFIVFFLLIVPFFGYGIIISAFSGISGFGAIKAEEPGREYPNVQVSVQELMTPADIKEIIQKTSPISFDQNPLAMLVSPFFLMVYSLIYLFYSFLKKGKHLDTLILLLIWFIGPFYATMTAVRFSILFSAPIAIGTAIILSKIFRIVSKGEKLED
jgi:dolichyl-diphosphooligosaccharide--protein glycosyltransferase